MEQQHIFLIIMALIATLAFAIFVTVWIYSLKKTVKKKSKECDYFQGKLKDLRSDLQACIETNKMLTDKVNKPKKKTINKSMRVAKFHENGDLMETYNSLREAEKETGISRHKIKQSINNNGLVSGTVIYFELIG